MFAPAAPVPCSVCSAGAGGLFGWPGASLAGPAPVASFAAPAPAGVVRQVADFFSFGTNDLTQMTFGPPPHPPPPSQPMKLTAKERRTGRGSR